jgi:hypothetical protein
MSENGFRLNHKMDDNVPRIRRRMRNFNLGRRLELAQNVMPCYQAYLSCGKTGDLEHMGAAASS